MDLKQEVSNLVAANGTLAKQLAREKVLRQRCVDTSAEKYKNLEQDLEKAIEAQDNTEEALNEFINEGRERITIREERVCVEPGGAAFIRAVCKLTHVGPKQYAKGIFLYSHLLLPLLFLMSRLFRVLFRRWSCIS